MVKVKHFVRMYCSYFLKFNYFEEFADFVRQHMLMQDFLLSRFHASEDINADVLIHLFLIVDKYFTNNRDITADVDFLESFLKKLRKMKKSFSYVFTCFL